MALPPGTRLGAYEIAALLGAGGMGEVYRARDTRLDRTVAIKVLPAPLEGIADSRERLEREARAISQLHHPNICVLHDIGHDEGVTFLVLEYLDGETLEQFLARGPLPLAAALKIAREIGHGLSAAHHAGVIHRDLKPGNVMLTKSGAKLLDFGLAKSSPVPFGSSSASALATAPPALTSQGTILGTIQYMAPEQLEGKEADHRSDIFAFGAMLYEMVTARKAFDGTSPASVIAAIMHKEPVAIASLHPQTPPLLGRVIARSLAKDPSQRWQSVADFLQTLQWSAEGLVADSTSRTTPASRRNVAVALGLAALLVGALTVWGARSSSQPAPLSPVVRFDVIPPGQVNDLMVDDRNFALSPDGRHLAFAATTENTKRLWVRSLDETTPRMMPGTEGVSRPFWSPDGRSIAFFADRKLKRIDLAGGAPRTVCDALQSGGGSWNREGVILFGTSSGMPLSRVSAGGGVVSPATQLADGHRLHVTPQFLPDGRQFLFVVDGGPSERGVYVGSLDDSSIRRLPGVPSGPALFAPPNALLFVLEGSLVAVGFDPVRAAVNGEPVTVSAITSSLSSGPPGFAVSEAGALAYLTSSSRLSRTEWVDRGGRTIERVTVPGGGRFGAIQLSADGRRLAGTRDWNIWLIDLTRGLETQFTAESRTSAPVWSPDNQRVAFAYRRNGNVWQMYEQSAADASVATPLLETPQSNVPLDWSSDGTSLLYQTIDPTTAFDVLMLPLTDQRTPVPVLQTAANEASGQFSPDSKWIAYESDESGSLEIYVKPLATPGRPLKVSRAGGIRPRWRADGRELFFLSDGQVMAVPIVLNPDGRSLEAGAPLSLFQKRLEYGTLFGLPLQNYAVAPDGQRFLMNVLSEDATPPPITVVLNWRLPAAATK